MRKFIREIFSKENLMNTIYVMSASTGSSYGYLNNLKKIDIR